MEKIVFNNSFIEYRKTPWDENVFQISTLEINKIHGSNIEEITYLLNKLEGSIKNKGLIYFRENSNNIFLKKILLMNGFYITEASAKLINSQIQKINFKLFNRFLNLENKMKKEYIEDIKNIAYTSFEYSRFHEDPFIDIEKARKRYINWIDDLLDTKNVLLYKSNGQIVSFMFYEKKDKKVNLILGGSKKEYGLITPLFFSSVMEYLKKINIKKVEVLISMSNIVIFNLYIKLGFTIKTSMFDYHKFITKERK